MSTSGTLVILIAVAIQKLSLRDPYQPTDLRHSIKAAINDEKPIKDYLTKYRQSELQFITGRTYKGSESLVDCGVVKQSLKNNPSEH